MTVAIPEVFLAHHPGWARDNQIGLCLKSLLEIAILRYKVNTLLQLTKGYRRASSWVHSHVGHRMILILSHLICTGV